MPQQLTQTNEERRLERKDRWGEMGETFGRNHRYLITAGTVLTTLVVLDIGRYSLVSLILTSQGSLAPSYNPFDMFLNQQKSFWGVRTAYSFFAMTEAIILKHEAPAMSRGIAETAANIVNAGEETLEKCYEYLHPHRR